ncbi:MAG: glycosyltransferase [Candidatus Hydrogenedens sp.]|nr:glycosyltransferase [Candidatus Hydrogenedens sp.]
MQDIEISVIVAVEGNADRLPVMLLHIEQQTFPASRMEVIIGDASHDTAVLEAVRNYGQGAPVPTRVARAGKTGILPVLNEAIRNAHGKLVLLLDQSVLASPRLVELHRAAYREHGPGFSSVGCIRPHPQLDAAALTAWFMTGAQQLGNDAGEIGYLDWRRSNILYERERVLAAGGFDEQYGAPPFADADLALRLQRTGMRARIVGEAIAYIAYTSSFSSELESHYQKGIGLRRLFEISRDPEILRRYPVPRDYARRMLDWMFVPFYIRACAGAEPDIRLLGHIYRRVFFCQRGRGWRAGARAAKRP